MRPHLIVLLCTTAAACGFTSEGFGQASPLAFTLDLTAPCSETTCSGTHPTEAGFQLQAGSFNYTAGSDSHGAYGLATLGSLTSPMVCDEVSQAGAGPVSSTRFAPQFSNTTLSGGVLDFNAGGNTIVDLSSLSYDGTNPAGVTSLYNNLGNPQVTCYRINPLGSSATSYAPGPADTVFHSSFDDHFNEPWVSVQTVNSPNATAPSAPTGPSSPIPTNTMAYVVQVHNAASAANWRLTLGYDHQYFSQAASGTAPWACVLPSSTPQPGALGGTCNTVSLPYTLKAADVQSATNSIYIYVDNTGSSTASTNWSAMTGAFYPAVAAVFPPFGIYPQRFDDKVAVASANNLPTANVTNIICNNDTTSTSCQVYGPESGANGGLLPAAIVNTNTFTSGGAITVDPIAYHVNPYGGSTLPGSNAADVLTRSWICNNPDNIFSGGTGLTVSISGTIQYNAVFRKSGNIYVAGTATCLLTYSTLAGGYSPQTVAVREFSVTMLPTTATHFTVSAPANAVAGTSFGSLLVTALDASNNVVPTYNGTVHFTASDTDGRVVLPPDTTLASGTGTFGATLITAGSQTITARDTQSSSIMGTSGSVAVSPASAMQYQMAVPSSATHGVQTSFLVTALDAYGNTATGYTGTVHFSSSDGQATLPADATLSGTTSFGVTFATIGTQTITATDTANSSLTKTSGSITVN